MSVANQGLFSGALVLCLSCAGCSLLWDPFLEERQQDSHDQSGTSDSEDLGSSLSTDCMDVPGNLVQNPSFEVLATGPNPNGRANNTGDPSSTIPGPWSGCCVQTSGGGTTWTVSPDHARCGQRSLEAMSKAADTNTLSQRLADQPDGGGKPFVLSGFVFVQGTGGGGRIVIEVVELMTQMRIAATETLSGPTTDRVALRQRGVVPRSGQMQLRISSSGNVVAHVDDLALRNPE
jgi:hypothetical protein